MKSKAPWYPPEPCVNVADIFSTGSGDVKTNSPLMRVGVDSARVHVVGRRLCEPRFNVLDEAGCRPPSDMSPTTVNLMCTLRPSTVKKKRKKNNIIKKIRGKKRKKTITITRELAATNRGTRGWNKSSCHQSVRPGRSSR